ncbi:amidase family protein [Kitasatospora sp. NPDC088346]|uniref:amidase family protein n=1 Tax=Kitasatospora sp. NPDC088346 TaxID=3364073 RepID=UPI003824FC14
MPTQDHPAHVPPALVLPLAERRRRLDAGALDPAGYRSTLLDHIRRTDPQVRAFTDWRPADTADAPVPERTSVSYKDTIHVAGRPTRLGIRSGYRDYPEDSAEIATRLAARGLTCVGKVTTTECALGTTKPSSNPRHPHVSTAGSSCGSAVAVAAGFCDVSVGSDSGGSLRWPAVYCGVTALRATPHPDLLAGVHAVSPSMESTGLVTRTAADLGWLWRHHSLADCFGTTRVPYPGQLRHAVAAPPGEPLHPQVGALLTAVDRVLTDHGHRPVAADTDGIWALRAPAGELLAREAHDSYAPVLDAPGVTVGPDTMAAIRRGAATDDRRHAALRDGQDRAEELLTALLTDELDILVLPLEAGLPDLAGPPAPSTLTGTAPGGGELTLIANYARLPVLALPLALSEQDSPLGVQVLAAPGADDLLVAVAETLEDLAGAIAHTMRRTAHA